jgi:hypothetical protein
MAKSPDPYTKCEVSPGTIGRSESDPWTRKTRKTVLCSEFDGESNDTMMKKSNWDKVRWYGTGHLAKSSGSGWDSSGTQESGCGKSEMNGLIEVSTIGER